MFNNFPECRSLRRLPGQILGRNRFAGDCLLSRVRALPWPSGRPTLPFPHPWNYGRPIDILGLMGASRSCPPALIAAGAPMQ
jgi:hypothetical protein